MVNSFVFSLDIPVTINTLHEMIETLHEKMLNALCAIMMQNNVRK